MTLTPAQHLQMEEDLTRLLPDGPPRTIGGFKGQRLGRETPLAPAEVVAYTAQRSVLHWRRFPMGGWVYWQTPARMQREDQGQDFEVPIGRHVIAPGWGKCIHHLADRPFPDGFGSPYAVVYIGSGRFAHELWYIGHVNAEVVPVDHVFHTGDILGRPDHSLNAGWGWTELGHAPNGFPGPFGEGARHHSLFAPVWRWSKT